MTLEKQMELENMLADLRKISERVSELETDLEEFLNCFDRERRSNKGEKDG